MSLERLHKVMAAAGAGSRRLCEEFIVEGRVSVNGVVVRELGTKIDPDASEIRLDGERLRMPTRVYYIVNKPQGVITTTVDEMRRPSVVDMIGEIGKRVYPVGRLDAQSTGLVLLTNDGELAQKLTHPSYEVPKMYEARVKGFMRDEMIARMKKGVWLSDGRATIEGVEIVKRRPTVTDMLVTMHEGKNREIRRVMAKLGHPVITLKRLSMGPLDLGDLKEGHHRKLTVTEVEMLRQITPSAAPREPRPPRRPQPTSSQSPQVAAPQPPRGAPAKRSYGRPGKASHGKPPKGSYGRKTSQSHSRGSKWWSRPRRSDKRG